MSIKLFRPLPKKNATRVVVPISSRDPPSRDVLHGRRLLVIGDRFRPSRECCDGTLHGFEYCLRHSSILSEKA